MKAIDL